MSASLRRFDTTGKGYILFTLGVFLSVFFCLVAPVRAEFQVPANGSSIVDLANVISPETELEIEKVISELENKADVSFALLTVDSLDGTPIETASLKVARSWKDSRDEEDFGLLILLAMEERQVRTEISYSLEEAISDDLSGKIQDELMLPQFKNEDYGEGLLSGIQAYALRVAIDRNVELTSFEPDTKMLETITYQEEQKADNSEDLRTLWERTSVLLIFLGIALISLIGGLIYFIPTIIAFSRGHLNKIPILLINIFFGWTFLGWFIALLMAIWRKEQQVLHIHQYESPPQNFSNSEKEQG